MTEGNKALDYEARLVWSAENDARLTPKAAGLTRDDVVSPDGRGGMDAMTPRDLFPETLQKSTDADKVHVRKAKGYVLFGGLCISRWRRGTPLPSLSP